MLHCLMLCWQISRACLLFIFIRISAAQKNSLDLKTVTEEEIRKRICLRQFTNQLRAKQMEIINLVRRIKFKLRWQSRISLLMIPEISIIHWWLQLLKLQEAIIMTCSKSLQRKSVLKIKRSTAWLFKA